MSKKLIPCRFNGKHVFSIPFAGRSLTLYPMTIGICPENAAHAVMTGGWYEYAIQGGEATLRACKADYGPPRFWHVLIHRMRVLVFIKIGRIFR